MSRYAKPVALIVVLGLCVVAALLLPVREWLIMSLAWIDAHRRVAWAIYIVVYVVATVALIPGSLLTLAAGFIFGLPLGVALVSIGSILGATTAFLVGRFFARAWVAKRLEGLPKFRALDSAVRDDGFTIVLLARLSPLFPFNVLNYGLGITAVAVRDYFFASWIGMLPATVVYVYVGTLAKDLTELGANGSSSTLTTILLVCGLIATIALTIVLTKRAGKALRAQLDAPAHQDDN
jgi:uncharacterized membrane protein YdjX (TVP38/TMEM64 family)